ncbi:sugar transferase [Flavipsychrobacter stenotrophus]|nr:sugar transferase [Flavipsychrobacter stenotrophus]
MNNNMPVNENGIIALLNVDEANYELIAKCDFGGAKLLVLKNGIELSQRWEREHLNLIAIISQSEVIAPSGVYLLETLQKIANFPDIPFFLLANKVTDNTNRVCLKTGVADVFRLPLRPNRLQIRANFLIQNWRKIRERSTIEKVGEYKTPLIKRIFDIVFSGTVLLCLSPFLLILIIIMKLESKGPIFYYSLRVGTGYKVFKFYKIRSMYVNADKRLKELKHLNQYSGTEGETKAEIDVNMLCDHCVKNGTSCQRLLYADDVSWCEKNYIKTRKAMSENAFIKLKNDPRVTKVGKVLRNTSIDELPQLWNVFIGDMSIVGNRPLPLYEAEKLTTDKYAMRFMAPAGITGLWQVEKRGKGEMSSEERMMLDNSYAETHSFTNDIKLILKTIPALFQKENV